MKNALKMLRAERGWSQAVLGEYLDVSRLTINAIEAERYDPSLPLAFKISRVFQLRIEEIFDDSSEVVRSELYDVRSATPSLNCSAVSN
ncbi:MAG: helix-turn-helix transcriptional regulator [Litoreibacter sp.]